MPIFEFPDVHGESGSSFRFRIEYVEHHQGHRYYAVGTDRKKEFRIPFVKNRNEIQVNISENALGVEYSFSAAMLLDETKNAFLKNFFPSVVLKDTSVVYMDSDKVKILFPNLEAADNYSRELFENADISYGFKPKPLVVVRRPEDMQYSLILDGENLEKWQRYGANQKSSSPVAPSSVVVGGLFKSKIARKMRERLTNLQCALGYLEIVCRESNNILANNICIVRKNILDAFQDEKLWSFDPALSDLPYAFQMKLQWLKNSIVADSKENEVWQIVMGELISAWTQKNPINLEELLAKHNLNTEKRLK